MPMIPKKFFPEDVHEGDKVIMSVAGVNDKMVELSYDDIHVNKGEKSMKMDKDEDPKTMPLKKLRSKMMEHDKQED